MKMGRWGAITGMVILGLVLAGGAQATLIDSGTVPYSYSNGTGSGTVEWWGYTEPGNPLQSEGATEDFLLATSEWTYRVTVDSGDFNFLNLHLGSAASSVLYLENPDTADYFYFDAGTCTFSTPCTTSDWSVYIDSSGTIKWSTDPAIDAPAQVAFFEFYSTLPESSRYTLSVGDAGETDILVGGPSVPEPASLLLLGSGLLGLAFWGRKKLNGVN